MSEKWATGDTARQMTKKYNNLVGNVEDLNKNTTNMITSEPVITISEHSDEDISNALKKNQGNNE